MVVALHWLRVCDYSFCYSVCYQQTVFVVSVGGCICPIVLFVNVFVLCYGTRKMLIVISEFTCLYQCLFLIICNLSSFCMRNGGKYVLRCFPQLKTNLLDFNIKILRLGLVTAAWKMTTGQTNNIFIRWHIFR